MNTAAIFWLVMLVIFLIAEAATVSLMSLWFAAGALAALAVSLLGGPVWLQGILFVAVSAVLLALLRPVVRRYLTPRLVKTNVEAVIGKTGVVTKAIDNAAAVGQIKLGAMEWTARSTDGNVIPEKTPVRVDRIEGVKAFVSAVKETEKV